MRQIEFKAGGLLYSIDWSHGSQGTEVKKTKMLAVTKATVTVFSPSGMHRRMAKLSVAADHSQYYGSETDCLKAEYIKNRQRIKVWKDNIEDAKKTMAVIKEKIEKKVK